MTDKWQPIETCPRDGTHILLFMEDNITEGYYHSGSNEWKGSQLSEHGCGCCGCPNEAPTHWQPLPPAPEKINSQFLNEKIKECDNAIDELLELEKIATLDLIGSEKINNN
jgi:hypothetical protein